MQEEVINVEGEEVLVREDTAKAHRFKQFGYILSFVALVAVIIVSILVLAGGEASNNILPAANNANVGP